MIKRFIMHAKKTAFIVEHDFIMAAYLADRVIVYDGQPSVAAVARKPQSLLTGARAAPSAWARSHDACEKGRGVFCCVLREAAPQQRWERRRGSGVRGSRGVLFAACAPARLSARRAQQRSQTPAWRAPHARRHIGLAAYPIPVP